MHSVSFKGKPNPKNPEMVRIEIILFKTGYARAPKVLDITGYYKNWDQANQRFRDVSSETVMVFNVLIGNKDDHAKNFSFILIDGEWQLSPAYDILPSEGFNGYHTTTINGQGEPTLKGMLSVAENIGLDKKRVKDIYEEVAETVKKMK